MEGGRNGEGDGRRVSEREECSDCCGTLAVCYQATGHKVDCLGLLVAFK